MKREGEKKLELKDSFYIYIELFPSYYSNLFYKESSLRYIKFPIIILLKPLMPRHFQ